MSSTLYQPQNNSSSNRTKSARPKSDDKKSIVIKLEQEMLEETPEISDAPMITNS